MKGRSERWLETEGSAGMGPSTGQGKGKGQGKEKPEENKNSQEMDSLGSCEHKAPEILRDTFQQRP